MPDIISANYRQRDCARCAHSPFGDIDGPVTRRSGWGLSAAATASPDGGVVQPVFREREDHIDDASLW